MNKELRYTVAPKDCLWNLAKRFYKDPLKWPAIFKYNNQQHIAKQNGTCIIDPDLIYIGQKLIIPPKAYADSVSYKEIQQIKADICSCRAQHAQKGKAEFAQIQRIRQCQPQPDKGGEPMARGFAKQMAKPAYSFDLGTISFGQVKSAGLVMKLSATGTLVLQDKRPANIILTAQNLNNLKFSSKKQAETELGKLIDEVGFKFDPKTKKLTLTGGIASKSNIKDAPTVKLEAAINEKGEQVFKGSATYKMVKGGSQTFSFVGEDVGFVFELSRSDAFENPENVEAIQVRSNEINWGTILMGVGIIATTLIEDIITAGIGIADDPITLSMGASMIYGGYRGYSLYKKSNVFRQTTRTAAGVMTASPLAASEDPIVIRPSEN